VLDVGTIVDADAEEVRIVYFDDEEHLGEAFHEEYSKELLLEHPTTIGWMFSTLVEIWSKRKMPLAVYERVPGEWAVVCNSVLGANQLGEGPRVSEALGRALLFTWETAE
jgi:hypothetical protein